MLIVLSGINPVEITEYAVVFSVVALPLTYLPILLIAGDRSFMGQHANGRFAAALGWAYFAVIVVLAFAAVPLLLATNGGGG
jgi:Mn2+/Fe2+ NRAMP family transporter